VPEFTQRWVPCQHCLQRIKLFSLDGEFDHVVWMHQDHDQQHPYRECETQEIVAVAIKGLSVAHPVITS
jgi:N6-adenosine-specific RNA methylase IME4